MGRPEPVSAVGSPLIAIGQGGLVAVMAVRDDQLSVSHQILKGGMTAGSEIFQTRWTTPYSSVTSISGLRDVSDCRGIKQGVYFARSAVKHENLTKMGAGCAKQVEPVGFGFGQGLLVTEYDSGGIVLDGGRAR